MIRLMYSSSLDDKLGWTDILNIVSVARQNNEKVGVTGILLSRGLDIMQVLEGESKAVTSLFGKIIQDTRHSNVQLILSEQIERRHFSQWKMKEVNVDRLEAGEHGWIKKLLPNDGVGLPQDSLEAYSLMRLISLITRDS